MVRVITGNIPVSIAAIIRGFLLQIRQGSVPPIQGKSPGRRKSSRPGARAPAEAMPQMQTPERTRKLGAGMKGEEGRF